MSTLKSVFVLASVRVWTLFQANITQSSRRRGIKVSTSNFLALAISLSVVCSDYRQRCEVMKLAFFFSGHLDRLQQLEVDLSTAHALLRPEIESAAQSVVRRKFAVVVGVSSYQISHKSVGLEDLENLPLNDARALSEHLKSLGFTVFPLLDEQAESTSIDAAATATIAVVRRENNLAMYFLL